MARGTWWATLGMAVTLALPAGAQGPGGGPGGPGGPGGGGGAAFQKFREQHKYTFQLTRMLRGLQELEKEPKNALTPTQAKGILAVLKPWQTKEKMTQDDAKNVMKGVKKVLTPAQLNVLSRVPERGGFGGRGGGGGGFGGPGGGGPPGAGPGGGGPPGGFRAGGPGGGPGGPGGGGRRFDPAQMKNFNPLLTKADPNNPMASRRVERNKQMYSMLSERASGKTAAKR
jgi:hypothetical protein